MITPIHILIFKAQMGLKMNYEDLQTCRLFGITLKELEESRKKENERIEQPQEISKDKPTIE